MFDVTAVSYTHLDVYKRQKEGYLFTDADYSQIELRVLAHMSGDEQLIEAYRSDADIHRITASKVCHLSLIHI